MAEANIEKGYKRGQMLSKKDQAREIAADNRARSDWKKSKITYKDDIRKAKNNYKANVAKTKSEYKNNYKELKANDNLADKIIYNPATRKRAAKYMTQNNMTMSEARKRARKDANRNTAIALGVIGSYSLYSLARNKLIK